MRPYNSGIVSRQPRALEIGSRLRHCDVTALIGEGGMDEVYRARDTRRDGMWRGTFRAGTKDLTWLEPTKTRQVRRHELRHRLLGALNVPVAVIAVVFLASLAAHAQPQTALTDGAGPPRTPWGDPDLQGIWNNFTITPLERPATLADQEFLSPEEAAALEQQAVDRFDRLNVPSVVSSEPLPVGGNVGAYNSFWTEEGTRVVPTRRTSLIVDPPNGRLPPLAPEAYDRITSPEALRLRDVREGRIPADGPEDLGLSERCLWYRGIPSFPTGYNNNYQILQTLDYVAILQEHIHDVRFIPLDGRPHLSPTMHQYAGDSRGRWEGETLVVETTNFKSPFIRRWNRPEHSLGRGDLSEALHVVERFTRAGPDTLDYEFTVSDPDTWTRPWSGSLPMARTEGPTRSTTSSR